MLRPSTISIVTLLAAARLLVAQPADTVRTTILSASGPSGVHKAWTASDGTLHFFSEFNDRGRGPQLRERITLGPDGFPRTIEIAGHDYFKTPVDERFVLEQAGSGWKAAWKELGSITPGKLADLIIVDGNPVERISDIRRVTYVMKNGAVYDPAAMYRAIGVRGYTAGNRQHPSPAPAGREVDLTTRRWRTYVHGAWPTRLPVPGLAFATRERCPRGRCCCCVGQAPLRSRRRIVSRSDT